MDRNCPSRRQEPRWVHIDPEERELLREAKAVAGPEGDDRE
jgi:hypothetical protein